MALVDGFATAGIVSEGGALEARRAQIFDPYHRRIDEIIDTRLRDGRPTVLVALRYSTTTSASFRPNTWLAWSASRWLWLAGGVKLFPEDSLPNTPVPPDRGERHEHERDAEGQPPPGVQGSSPCLEHPRLPLTVDNLSKRRKLITSVTSHTAFTDVKRDNCRQSR